MSVAALSTAGFSQYISASSNLSASQQAMQSLQQSLASGNLAAAQSAFNTYQQLNQSPSTTSGSSSSSSSSSSSATTSQLSTDMAALGSAIGSGDLSTAQSAFATVQSDLKTTPSPAIANAETAVAQTVQWVEDLLNISGSNSSSTTPLDPTTSMLDSAYGNSSPSTATDPTTGILDSAYGAGGNANSSSGSSSPAVSGNAGSSASSIPSDGNSGSGASVNVYA